MKQTQLCITRKYQNYNRYNHHNNQNWYIQHKQYNQFSQYNKYNHYNHGATSTTNTSSTIGIANTFSGNNTTKTLLQQSITNITMMNINSVQPAQLVMATHTVAIMQQAL